MPPPPPPAAQGMLCLTVQGSVLSNMLTPDVRINGWAVPVKYGANMIPVYAGANRVEVSAVWLRTYGRAQLDVQVPAGQQVNVFYALPWHTFIDGAIGYERQTRPGLGVLLAIASLFVVVPAIFIMIAAMAG